MTREEAIEVLKLVEENASCDDCLYYAQMEDCPTDEDCIIVQAIRMAKQALSQVSEIEENIIKYMKKYPNHVGNTDFWEGFYACRNVVLQLDDEEYAPKKQEPCDDATPKDIFCIGCDYKEQEHCTHWKNGKCNGNTEPCNDAISRDMALEKMADFVASGYADSVEDFEEYSRIICQLPSVTQKSETETWNSMHGKQITAPKGTFKKIWEDAESEDKE